MRTTLILGGLFALATSAFLIERVVRASGPPATQPLWYAGYLEKDGAPVEGPVGLAVNLWDADVDGNQVCSRAAMETPIARGRFRVALPDACVAAVKANPEMWIEVVIGGTDFLPRSKLAAMPFAIEAANASAAAGALEGRIAAIERPIFAQNGKQYAIHGKYCGETAAVDGALGSATTKGYAGAKALCEAVSGCAATAHVCTTDEILRHITTGGTFTAANVWYASGVNRHLVSAGTPYGWSDCNAFSATTNVYGSIWVKASNIPGAGSCVTAFAIACCD